MRLKSSTATTFAGVLGSIHVLSDWTTATIMPIIPVWANLYVSYFAVGILALATWLVLPTLFRWLGAFSRACINVHSSINGWLLTVALKIIKLIGVLVRATEVYLVALAKEGPVSD
jgi:hypothetical protein